MSAAADRPADDRSAADAARESEPGADGAPGAAPEAAPATTPEAAPAVTAGVAPDPAPAATLGRTLVPALLVALAAPRPISPRTDSAVAVPVETRSRSGVRVRADRAATEGYGMLAVTMLRRYEARRARASAQGGIRLRREDERAADGGAGEREGHHEESDQENPPR